MKDYRQVIFERIVFPLIKRGEYWNDSNLDFVQEIINKAIPKEVTIKYQGKHKIKEHFCSSCDTFLPLISKRYCPHCGQRLKIEGLVYGD